jgi:exosortase C (VPDSG-CTERM-specific)
MKDTIPQRITGLAALAALLVLCFGPQLCGLARRAFHSDLYSHILLIPFISAYLIFLKRRDLALDSERARVWALAPILSGAGLLAGYWWTARAGWKPKPDDYLALMTLSFLLFLWGGGFLCLGLQTLRRVAFPAAFLIFMVPFPVMARHGIESFFQNGSADAADLLFKVSGAPVFRQGIDFRLPGMVLEVAPQCSGIHSSLVLFITSWLAGYLFLKSPWRRAALTMAVIPLALARNGLRILTIGQLCLHVSPDMINSPIHHHGGPLFFALSLIPFFLLLHLLRRSESRNPPPVDAPMGYGTSARGRVPSRCLFTFFALALVAAGGAGCSKQARIDRHLARAIRDVQAEKYDEAEIEYLIVLRAAPRNPVATRQLGLLYDTEGRPPQAFALLQKAAELEPANLDVRLKMGLMYLAAHKTKEAREAAAQVLQKQPQNEQALLLLAEAATTNQAREIAQRIEQLPTPARGRAGSHLALGTLALVRQDLPRAEAEFKAAVAADAKSSEAYMALGALYLARNDRAQAEPAVKMAAELAPLRSPLRLRYAQFKLRTGAQEEGKRLVEEITRKAPDYVPAWVLLAQLAFDQAKTEECAALLDNVLARDRLNYDALLLRGNLSLAKGDSTNAIAYFERLAKAYDRDPQVQYRLAVAHLLNKEPIKADANLNRALVLNSNYVDAILLQAELNLRQANSGAAISSLTRLLKQQPQPPRAYMLLANAHLAQNRPDDAVQVYRQMTQAFPKEPQAALLLGMLLARQNRPADARQAFEKALELAPGFLPALEQIVDLDLAEKQFPRAKARIQQLIDKNAAAAQPWLLMARIHLAQAMALVRQESAKRPAPAPAKLRFADVPATQPEVDQAEKALLKAIELDPNLQPAYPLLAQLYVSSNKHQQALDRLSNLVAKTNDVTALMEIGMIHDELKQFSAARDAYEKVIAVDPNFTPALNNLAYLYSEPLRQPDKAYALAEKARQLLPNDPSVADTLGWIHFQRAEYDWALAMIQESALKLAADAEVQFHLGMAHYMMGEEGAARVALRAAVQDTKDFPGKDEARRRLAVLALDVKTANPAQVAELRKRLTQSPNDTIAASRLAAILERDGAFDQAAGVYEAALKNNLRNVSGLSRLAELYANRLNDPRKALELAKQAHNLAPEDGPISHLLGRLVFQTGDHKWAASLLEESARKLPNAPAVLYDLAWAYYSLGRVAEAEAAMHIPALDPTFAGAAEAKRFLAMVAASRSPTLTGQTIGELRKTLAAEPAYLPVLFLCALADEQQGKPQEAAGLYDRILARYPLFAPAARNLALLCAERLGDDHKAYTLATQARESFPADARLARALGILAYRQADYSRSAQLLSDSARNAESDAEMLYYLGMAQYRLKQRAQSKETLQRALALNMPAKFAAEARRTLAELK